MRYYIPLSIANLLFLLTYIFSPLNIAPLSCMWSLVNHSSYEVRSAAGTEVKQRSHWLQNFSSLTQTISPRGSFSIPGSFPPALTRTNSFSSIVPSGKRRLPLVYILMISGSLALGIYIGIVSSLTRISPVDEVLIKAIKHGKIAPNPISQSKNTPMEPVLLPAGLLSAF